jgi:uncharacterized membrane protein YfcA
MTLFEIVVLFVAGIGAGTINTVVGSGSLITFPALLAFGYPPIIAAGAIIGGQLGAHIGRRLPAPIYRAVIVIVGVAAFFKLVLT